MKNIVKKSVIFILVAATRSPALAIGSLESAPNGGTLGIGSLTISGIKKSDADNISWFVYQKATSGEYAISNPIRPESPATMCCFINQSNNIFVKDSPITGDSIIDSYLVRWGFKGKVFPNKTILTDSSYLMIAPVCASGLKMQNLITIFIDSADPNDTPGDKIVLANQTSAGTSWLLFDQVQFIKNLDKLNLNWIKADTTAASLLLHLTVDPIVGTISLDSVTLKYASSSSQELMPSTTTISKDQIAQLNNLFNGAILRQPNYAIPNYALPTAPKTSCQ